MRRLKRSFCMLLSIIIFSMLISSYNASAVEICDFSNKIDLGLLKKMSELKESDCISVSLWFRDIDHSEVKEKTKINLSKDISSGKIQEKAIDFVFSNDSSDCTITNLNKFKNDEMNIIISEKRAVMYEEITKNNRIYFNKLTDDLNGITPKVLSFSQSAPYVDCVLTKEQIEIISEKSYIDCIYYINEDITFKDDEEELDDDYDEIDTSYFNVTGLASNRDNFGLDGANMKVGVVEASYVPNRSHLPNSDITNLEGDYSPSNTSGSFHAVQVCSLLVGNVDYYTGAIPNAKVYCSALQSMRIKEYIFTDILDQGVTAINMSMSPNDFIDSDEHTYNVYGSFSRYLDYLSINYDVTFIMSSGNHQMEGNPQNSGVPGSNMAYNPIIVGACTVDGELTNFSSYNFTNNKAFKPDLVAPGIVNTQCGYMVGTSASAPLVTAAVIQLQQAVPALIAKPQLIKSLLLSSSTITDYMNDNNIFTTPGYHNNYIACSKEYGAGMLNANKAYLTSIQNGNSFYQTLSFNCPEINYFPVISNTNSTIRVSLCWEKITTDIYNYSLDSVVLQIYTPSGVRYESNYLFDSKQIVTFDLTETGTYNIKIFNNHYSISGQNTNIGVSFSIF